MSPAAYKRHAGQAVIARIPVHVQASGETGKKTPTIFLPHPFPRVLIHLILWLLERG